MTQLAPILQAFFTTRLTSQYGASPHTIAAYRDTWRLLLRYVEQTTGIAPAALDLAELDSNMISGFLEPPRDRTRQRRHAPATPASLRCTHCSRYGAYHHPEHADTISRVLAIPAKRAHRTDITYLSPPEVTALLAAPAPDHRGRAPRPRSDPSRCHHRTAGLRTHRADTQRRPPRHRRPRRLPREGTEGPDHARWTARPSGSFETWHGRSATTTAAARVPQPRRNTAEPRRRRGPFRPCTQPPQPRPARA